MKSVLIISGWAHGIEAIKAMGDALTEQLNVDLLTGAQVLKEQFIPETDYIITGSMGGLLVMELLPERCQKLVLISSTAKFCAGTDYTSGTHEKILKRMILMLKRNPEAVLEDFFKNVHHPHPHTCANVVEPLDSLVAGLEYLLKSDVRHKIPNIRIPVQLFHGREDRIIPAEASNWLHQNLPDSRLTLFENDGHALPAHHFAELMAEISQFLELH